MATGERHKWKFRARFRRRAFGWRSQPAIKRVREAVSEIKRVARKDKALAGEGAVLFLEKVAPALEQVDSSSGAIGTAVHKAVAALVDVIAAAPADTATREGWLERLFRALEDDDMPYIETLADHWGTLCASPALASRWADRLLPLTREALHPDRTRRGYFQGTSACLSALYTAGRYDELVALLRDEPFWHYRQWAARALLAQGRRDDALRYAEATDSAWHDVASIDAFCEEALLAAGFVDEAYEKYAARANGAGTYLAWFRAIVRKYPHKAPEQILSDLVARTPGDEGKWFAAAKDAGLYQEALDLANRAPCAPQTLNRAARDFADKNAAFALEAGMASLRWLLSGYGYDITNFDVFDAYTYTMKAAENLACPEQTRQRIRELVARESSPDAFVTRVLGGCLDLP